MERGEKIALVGANGIGKTTLLKEHFGSDSSRCPASVTLGDYLEIGYFEQEMRPGEYDDLYRGDLEGVSVLHPV